MRVSKFLLILLLISLNSISLLGQKKTEKGDLILILKDKSRLEVNYLGSNQQALFTKPNFKGGFNFSNIDTIVIINDLKKNLRELVYKVPIKLSNNQPFYIKDLFIKELPYTNNGELSFENKTLIKENTPLYFDRILSKLSGYAKEIIIYEQNRANKKIAASIAYPMSPGTRSGKYLFMIKQL